jgi:hypothetical protein
MKMLLPPFAMLEETAQSEASVEIDASSSLALLQSIYRNPLQPLSVRMRAAALAIPYEFAKLSVTQNHVSVALLLEDEMARQGKGAVIDARPLPPKVLEPRR